LRARAAVRHHRADERQRDRDARNRDDAKSGGDDQRGDCEHERDRCVASQIAPALPEPLLAAALLNAGGATAGFTRRQTSRSGSLAYRWRGAAAGAKGWIRAHL